MAKAIPDRWLNYLPIGQRIAGTRFIAFKVPLRQNINERVEQDHRLAPQSLLKSVPNLGLIVDLTNTNRYYDPQSFTDHNVEHQKLMIPGHQTPPKHLAERFCNYATDFLEANSNNDKLIGVHCTHGVNRTGYLICYYMITRMNMSSPCAMKTFADARGHHIERENYTKSLENLKQENTEIEDWLTTNRNTTDWQQQQTQAKRQQQHNRAHHEMQEDRQEQQNVRFQKARDDLSMYRRWQYDAPRETPYSRKPTFYSACDRHQKHGQEGSWRQQSYQRHPNADVDYVYKNYDNYCNSYDNYNNKSYRKNNYSSTNNYSRNNYSRNNYSRDNYDEYSRRANNSSRNYNYGRESSYNRQGKGKSQYYRDYE